MSLLFFNIWDTMSQQSATEEQEAEIGRLKLVVFFIIGMLVSGYYSWNEFRYAFFSSVYEGVVTKVQEVEQVHTRRRRFGYSANSKVLEVVYVFKVENEEHKGSQELPLASPFVEGQQVKIQHIPVDYIINSRIKGTGDATFVWIFLLFTGFVAGGIVWIAQQMNTPYKKSKDRVNPIRPAKKKKVKLVRK